MAKFEMKVTELDREDLINLFSTAIYCNEGSMYIEIPEELEEAHKGHPTREDKWASVLLDGGELIIVDYNGQDDESADDVEFYGEKGKNYVDSFIREEEVYSYLRGTGYTIYVPCYRINMKTLLDGLNNPEACHYLKELFVTEEGDMYTAYNLLQIAVFGEVIYG